MPHKVIEVDDVIIDDLEEQLKSAQPPVFWDDRQISILKRYFGKVDKNDLAKTIGKTVCACEKKACALGLTHKRNTV
jgi:hypothetical protein